MQRLDGYTAIVTGASGAIGQAVVERLLQEGASAVLVTDLPQTNIVEISAGWDAHTHAVATDLSDPAGARELMRACNEYIGSPDILVNVAGAWQIIDYVDSDENQWMSMIRANLLTAMSACHAVLPGMLERHSGSIVNFASTAGEYGSIRPSAAYAGAKGGVIAFTKSLAREVSPEGVRVNAISPGPIDTPALKAASPEQRAIAAARTLVGRLGRPEDIAAGVAYLASEDSAFVTGTVLQVNGGSLL
ncbi:MAG: SDR family NAD(P)-dependent oxidoreductase [Actinomycetota bacterium]